jgi:RHS repeat-associated protein
MRKSTDGAGSSRRAGAGPAVRFLHLAALALSCVSGPDPIGSRGEGTEKGRHPLTTGGGARSSAISATVTSSDVGTLPGSLAVSAEGTAGYDIPLWMPEGRNGLSPDLRLVYASSNDDGLLGTGWMLTGGQSMIHRCPSDSRRFERPQALVMTSFAADEICLDGRPLVLVSGSHGAPGAKYRTEPDTFAEISVVQADATAPLRFEVRNRQGLIHEYGSTDTTLLVQGWQQAWVAPATSREDSAVTNSTSTRVFVRYGWLRGATRDRFDNRIVYRFVQPPEADDDLGFQEPRLTSVEYVHVADQPTRLVQLDYQPRADGGTVRESFVAGLRFRTSHLLRAIEVKVLPPGASAFDTVRLYQLTHAVSPASRRMLLTQAQECDGNPAIPGRTVVCRKPTVFSYDAGRDDFQDIATGISDLRRPGDDPFWILQAADLDNDGKDDIVYRSRAQAAAGGTAPRWYYRLSTGAGFGPAVDLGLLQNTVGGDAVIADFARSDGRPDIAVPASPNTLTFFANTSSGAVGFTSIASGAMGTTTAGVQLGVFGGRGRMTLLRPLNAAGDFWGYGLFSGTVLSGISGPLDGSWERAFLTAGWTGQPLDFDGEGATDGLALPPGGGNRLLVMRQRRGTPIFPDQGQDLADEFDYIDTTLLASAAGDVVRYVFFDHNGDGLSDALRLRQGQLTPDLIINSGNDFAPPRPLFELIESSANIQMGPGTAWADLIDPGVRVLDFDGDGREDLLLVDDGVARDSTVASGPTRGTLQVLLSRDGGFEPRSLTIPVGLPADGPVDPASPQVHNYKQSQLLDANGDGLLDLVQISAADQRLHLYLRQGGKRDLLVGVTDGMGTREAIGYRPMIDPAVYQPGTSCSFPQQCLKRGQWLVRSHRRDNGIGAQQNETRYRYRDARIDLLGAGHLGFAERAVETVASSTTVTETYDLTTTATIPMRSHPAATTGIYFKLGLPVTRVRRTVDPGVTRVLTTTLDHEFVPTNNQRSYYTRPTRIRNLEEEIRGGITTRLRDQTQTSVYDPTLADLGLLSGSTTTSITSAGTHTRSWTTTYQNDTSAWLIGVPLGFAETDRVPGGETTTRTVALSPEPGRGVPRFIDMEPTGGLDDFLRVDISRNGFGQVTSVRRIDRAATIREERVTYDEQSVHPRTVTNAVGHVTTVIADPAFGTIRSVTDPNGVTTTLDYDFFALLRRIDEAGGAGQSVGYSREPEPGSVPADGRDVWRVTSTFDGGGEVSILVNRLGQQLRREVKSLDASFSFETRSYNDLGLLAQLTRPARVGAAAGPATSWIYDELGRLKSQTRPEDGLDAAGNPVTSADTRFAYAGHLTTITDEFGRLRRVRSDEFGRPVRSEARNDSGQWVPTEFTFGPFDLARFVTRRSGAGSTVHTTEATYDVRGRRTLLRDPDTGTRTFRYNAFGEVREETDAAGAVTTYTLDAEGRVVVRVDKDGTTTFVWDTAANGRGSLAETLSPSGVHRRFEYDTAGRLSREIWTIRSTSYVVDYAYDSEGRPSRVSYPEVPGFSRFVAVQSYDADSGQLARVDQDGVAAPLWELRSTEADGQITQEAFGNDVRTDYTYSSRTGRVGTITSASPATTLRSWSYRYWMDGNLQRRSDLIAGEHERFEYDGLDRIKRWLAADGAGRPLSGGWTVNFTLSDFGNLNRRQFIAGPVTGGTSQDLTFTQFTGTNRVQTSPWGSYGYDANGNQVARPGGEAIAYTAFDLPKTITGPRAAGFLYDAFGMRAEKRRSDNDFTVYVSELYEKRRAGAAIDHVFYVATGSGAVVQVMRREGGAESTLYAHPDRLGSMDAVTDAGGAVTERTRRDPFGNKITNFNVPALPSTIVPSTNRVRLGFTGHEQDDELGLINMRGRMYDPRLGRFLTPDPLIQDPLLGESYNRYAYALGNPLKFVDPTGLQADRPPECDYGEESIWCQEARKRDECPPFQTRLNGVCTPNEGIQDLSNAGVGVYCGYPGCITEPTGSGGGSEGGGNGGGIPTGTSTGTGSEGSGTGPTVPTGGGNTGPGAVPTPPAGTDGSGMTTQPPAGTPAPGGGSPTPPGGNSGTPTPPPNPTPPPTNPGPNNRRGGGVGPGGFGVADAVSLGVGLLPFAGTGQSIVELVTGRDYITGRPANRWLALGGIVAGVLPGGKALLKGGAAAAEFATRGGGNLVKVFRVEGRANQRLLTGPGGALTVEGSQTLFLNFGNEARALDFLGQRLAQGRSDSVIKSFQVPRSFLDDLARTAVPERLGRMFPDSPIIVDTTRASNQFGLRPPQIEALRRLLGSW